MRDGQRDVERFGGPALSAEAGRREDEEEEEIDPFEGTRVRVAEDAAVLEVLGDALPDEGWPVEDRLRLAAPVVLSLEEEEGVREAAPEIEAEDAEARERRGRRDASRLRGRGPANRPAVAAVAEGDEREVGREHEARDARQRRRETPAIAPRKGRRRSKASTAARESARSERFRVDGREEEGRREQRGGRGRRARRATRRNGAASSPANRRSAARRAAPEIRLPASDVSMPVVRTTRRMSAGVEGEERVVRLLSDAGRRLASSPLRRG